MNIQHMAIASLGLLAIMGTAGCASVADPETTVSSGEAELSAWSAPCNLEVERDGSGPGWVALYSQPTLAEQTDLELYGGTVANDACADAQIIQWQQVRRQSGHSDAICRVIWTTDSDGSIRDLGCAVPAMVVER